MTLEVSSALLHDGVLDSRSDHICLNGKLRIRYNGHESIVKHSQDENGVVLQRMPPDVERSKLLGIVLVQSRACCCKEGC